MENLKPILSNYLIFVIVFAICLVIITIMSLIYSKKKNKNSIYLYGMFMDYTTGQTVSLSLIIMNFLLLGFLIATKKELTLAVIITSTLLILVSFIINKKFIKLIMNVVINAVNLGIVYFAHLVDTLRVDTMETKYLFLQIAIMASGLLFYIFTSFKFVNDLRKKG